MKCVCNRLPFGIKYLFLIYLRSLSVVFTSFVRCLNDVNSDNERRSSKTRQDVSSRQTSKREAFCDA